jgi:hypothetical protein
MTGRETFGTTAGGLRRWVRLSAIDCRVIETRFATNGVNIETSSMMIKSAARKYAAWILPCPPLDLKPLPD